MKRLINYIVKAGVLSAFVFSLCSCSCGGSKPAKAETVVTPSKASVSGPLGEYFKVVERNYKIKNGNISIEFERIKDGLPNPWVAGMEVGSYGNCVEPGFTVEFLDVDGDILCKWKSSVIWEKDDINAVLALGVGETCSLPCKVEVRKGVVSFRVSSTFKYHGLDYDCDDDDCDDYDDDDYDDYDDDEDYDASSELDDVLDDYEKILNTARSVSKTAASGSATISECVDLLEDVADMAADLEDALY